MEPNMSLYLQPETFEYRLLDLAMKAASHISRYEDWEIKAKEKIKQEAQNCLDVFLYAGITPKEYRIWKDSPDAKYLRERGLILPEYI